MKESAERTIRLGLTRSPKKICDEIDSVTADMIRQGWIFCDTCTEESLGYIHLFFERELLSSS